MLDCDKIAAPLIFFVRINCTVRGSALRPQMLKKYRRLVGRFEDEILLTGAPRTRVDGVEHSLTRSVAAAGVRSLKTAQHDKCLLYC